MSQGMSPAAEAKPSSGLAIASMVVGIVSIVAFCFWPVSVPCGIVAAVLGFVARSKATAGTGGGKGMATAGIACGIIGAVLGILWVAGALAFLNVMSQNPEFKKAMEKGMEQQKGAPGGGQGSLVDPWLTYIRGIS